MEMFNARIAAVWLQPSAAAVQVYAETILGEGLLFLRVFAELICMYLGLSLMPRYLLGGKQKFTTSKPAAKPSPPAELFPSKAQVIVEDTTGAGPVPCASTRYFGARPVRTDDSGVVIDWEFGIEQPGMLDDPMASIPPEMYFKNNGAHHIAAHIDPSPVPPAAHFEGSGSSAGEDDDDSHYGRSAPLYPDDIGIALDFDERPAASASHALHRDVSPVPFQTVRYVSGPQQQRVPRSHSMAEHRKTPSFGLAPPSHSFSNATSIGLSNGLSNSQAGAVPFSINPALLIGSDDFESDLTDFETDFGSSSLYSTFAQDRTARSSVVSVAMSPPDYSPPRQFNADNSLHRHPLSQSQSQPQPQPWDAAESVVSRSLLTQGLEQQHASDHLDELLAGASQDIVPQQHLDLDLETPGTSATSLLSGQLNAEMQRQRMRQPQLTAHQHQRQHQYQHSMQSQHQSLHQHQHQHQHSLSHQQQVHQHQQIQHQIQHQMQHQMQNQLHQQHTQPPQLHQLHQQIQNTRATPPWVHPHQHTPDGPISPVSSVHSGFDAPIVVKQTNQAWVDPRQLSIHVTSAATAAAASNASAAIAAASIDTPSDKLVEIIAEPSSIDSKRKATKVSKRRVKNGRHNSIAGSLPRVLSDMVSPSSTASRHGSDTETPSIAPTDASVPHLSPADSSSEGYGKLFTCNQCDATFRIKGYLTRHVKKHAELKAYTCPYYTESHEHKCHPTGGFSRRDTYKTHLKTRHFLYPKGTTIKERSNKEGRCGACGESFESNEAWIESHVHAGACPGYGDLRPDSHSKAKKAFDTASVESTDVDSPVRTQSEPATDLLHESPL